MLNRMSNTTKLVLAGLNGLALNLAVPGLARAAELPEINTGDSAFVAICAALVFIMTPGLAMFYGGMVRRKNVLSIMMQCFTVMALVSVQWVILGYSLSFGPDISHLVGGLDWLGFNGVGLDPSTVYATTVPQPFFAMFQLMFAIITLALITGAFAERISFKAFILFSLLWTTLVYDPLAHWVWAADGWLFNLGALDFAGGTVVHISSGVSGLVAAVIIGKRLGKSSEPMMPHDVTMTMLGAGLLWFGWFGFNSGSALAANGLAASAFLVTNTAAAAGAIAWAVAEWWDTGKPTALGAASGAIAGLVVITPAAGFVGPMASVIMGFIVGPLCYLAVAKIKEKFGYDDSLDAFGIHGVGGITGALLTGVFATTAINSAGKDGLLAGNPEQLLIQLIAVAATIAFAGIMTAVILKVVNIFTPLRVSAECEESGLDISDHGQVAYYADTGA